MKKLIILLLIMHFAVMITLTAQNNIAINTSGTIANAASILDLTNTSKLGLLIPRTSSLSTISLTSPAQGLLFYNSNTNLLNVNTSATTTPVWVPLGNSPISNALSAGTTASIIINTVNGIPSTTPLDLTSAITTSSWGLAGNSITSASTTAYGTTANNSYLGTTSSVDLILETNATDRMHILSASGNVGIGAVLPASTLEVNGTFGSQITKDNYAVSTTAANSILYFSTVQSTTKTLTMPAASTCTNRKYMIVNILGTTFTISPGYYNSAGSTTLINTIAINSSIEIISNGSSWYQIY